MKNKICVIGGGRWGQNHIKTLSALGALAAIVEANPQRLAQLTEQYPSVKGYTSIDQAIDAAYAGYTIATPAETHFTIAEKIISRGFNVLIEKPMTMTALQSEELVELAEKTGSRLMVGHVLLFHPAIIKIKQTVESGKIGDLFYLYSTRLNLGTIRTEESVFSSFAPHDISVLDYIIGKPAIDIQAKGTKFLQENIYDSTMTQLTYPGNIHAHIYVSWLHPFKEQKLVVVGSKGMISFDDSTIDKEIHYYNKRIDFDNGVPVKVEHPDEVIPYEKKMPLEQELQYFIDHLDKKIEVADGKSGYEVVKILETVQQLIEKQK